MTIKSLAMAASAVAIGILALGATPAAAQNCGRMVYGTPAEGPVFQRLLIEPRARRNWSARVRAYGYSGAYATWANARDKVIDCKKNAPGKRWICTARGRPCRT
jgi:hypothetical protein